MSHKSKGERLVRVDYKGGDMSLEKKKTYMIQYLSPSPGLSLPLYDDEDWGLGVWAVLESEKYAAVGKVGKLALDGVLRWYPPLGRQSGRKLDNAAGSAQRPTRELSERIKYNSVNRQSLQSFTLVPHLDCFPSFYISSPAHKLQQACSAAIGRNPSETPRPLCRSFL
eukprot:119447-Amorphochlora_amoeboformis.AAC.1